MVAGETSAKVEIVDSIKAVPAAQWDYCAGDACPLISHAFLEALEDSASVASQEGWAPCHVAISDDGGEIIGCAPLYLKGHSQGEYVFDHGWAEAFERAGGRYYPKLVSAIPFAPVTSHRLLVRPDQDVSRVRAMLIAGMLKAAERFGVSSLHVNFPLEDEWHEFGSFGFLQRTGHQFHWYNDGFGSFDDFLGTLASRKRKNIRKERRAVAEAGVVMHRFSGDSLHVDHMRHFYRFYCDTTDRKWGWDYLKESFFDMLHEHLADKVVLVMAMLDGQWVAGALNLAGRSVLYGRQWGCTAKIPFLHFETCYYQAIEHAIEHGLHRVEAGAQGPHKLQRGYMPSRTYSAHWIVHEGLRRAVSEFLDHETRAVDAEMEFLEERAPFRKC